MVKLVHISHPLYVGEVEDSYTEEFDTFEKANEHLSELSKRWSLCMTTLGWTWYHDMSKGTLELYFQGLPADTYKIVRE